MKVIETDQKVKFIVNNKEYVLDLVGHDYIARKGYILFSVINIHD